jgi:hypothetical protein
MAQVGFVPGNSDKALFIDTGSNTYNQRVTDKMVKRDLVINFRKPWNGEKPTIRPERVQIADFEHLAESIIVEYLAAHPGSAKDRIYDHLVNALIRRGCMQDHDFEKLLRKMAHKDSATNRWFLRHT